MKSRCPGMTAHSSRRLLVPDKATTGSGLAYLHNHLSSCPHVESNCSLIKLSLSGVSLVNTQECGVRGNAKDMLQYMSY